MAAHPRTNYSVAEYLASIDCTLALAEMYERVTFTAPEEGRQ